MATALNLVTSLGFSGTYTNPGDIESGNAPIRKVYSHQYVDGSDAGEANTWWADTISIAASGTTLLDLTGGNTDRFGNVLTFTYITEIMLFNRSTTAGQYVDIGNNFLSTFTGHAAGVWNGTFTHYIRVFAGGVFYWRSPIAGAAIASGGSGTDGIALDASAALDVDLILVGIR